MLSRTFLNFALTELYIVSKGRVKVDRFSTDKRKQMSENLVFDLNRSNKNEDDEENWTKTPFVRRGKGDSIKATRKGNRRGKQSTRSCEVRLLHNGHEG